MTNIVNLNKVRKTSTRAKKRAQADENTVKFGQSKAQKRLNSAKQAKATLALDGAKKDPQNPQ